MALRRTPMKRGTSTLERKTPLRARRQKNGPDNGEESEPSRNQPRRATQAVVVDASPSGDASTTVGEGPDNDRPRMDLEAAGRALRNAAASASAPRREHKPVPPVSQREKKPSNTGFPPVVRQTIFDRDAYACWRCGADVTVKPGSLQHRDNRGMGGASDPAINWPSNGIVLCGSGSTGCHGWADNENPTEAARLGYVVKSWADPETVPVFHVRLGWMLLTRTGNRYSTKAPTNGDAHAVARRKEVR